MYLDTVVYFSILAKYDNFGSSYEFFIGSTFYLDTVYFNVNAVLFADWSFAEREYHYYCCFWHYFIFKETTRPVGLYSCVARGCHRINGRNAKIAWVPKGGPNSWLSSFCALRQVKNGFVFLSLNSLVLPLTSKLVIKWARAKICLLV